MYVHINNLLGDKVNPMPSNIRNTSFINEDEAKKYVSIYYETSDVPNGQKIEITAEGKDLYITNTNGKNKLIYFHEENPWFGIDGSTKLIMFDKEDINTLRLVDGVTKTAIYKRRVNLY